MNANQFFRCFYTLFIIVCLSLTCTDGKGFGRGGGFKGGSRGGFGKSKSAGTFGGSSGYNRPNNYGSYNSMNKPSSGSSFKKNAMSFGAGALGGVAAYSLMSSMSHSYRPGYYAPGYGTGQTCVNNEVLNGTQYGQFRCPLNGFPHEHKFCCGPSEKQYCCTREESSGFSPSRRSSFNLLWICIIVAIVVIVIVLLAKHRRKSYKDSVMVPVEPQFDDVRPAFYQPPPPQMNYPPNVHPYTVPPQMNYPPNVNPYTVPPQNYNANYTPYPPQTEMPYPPQQPPYNPYQVTEAAPPNYNDAVENNQKIPTTKPI